MIESGKTLSAFISSQLPDFVRADHPLFKRFLELYYQWMEQNNPDGISNTAGNTIYHAMQIENYRDIDQTPPEFVKYFKDEILPYFPDLAHQQRNYEHFPHDWGLQLLQRFEPE